VKDRKIICAIIFLTSVLLLVPIETLINRLTGTSAICTAEAATFKLSDVQYKIVKGWWSYNSSGGWDVKFTRTKVKYYDRETGKASWTATIKNCKKKNDIYIYYVKSKYGESEYRTTTKYKDVLEDYDSWDDSNISEYYSGSSSLSRGKWMTDTSSNIKIKIGKCAIDSISTQYYTGKAIKPEPQIKYDGQNLVKGTDYTLSYKNNVKPGTASVMIKGKGNYTGSKTIKFKIKRKPRISLSKKSITLSLAGTRTKTLEATTKNTSKKVSWKSSDKKVATVKNGKITAKKCGTATITATASGVSATCKVTVKDTLVKTITYSFKTLDEWKEAVNKKERQLVFGGKTGITYDGKTYYTGNIIVNRKIISYKKIKTKVSINTPGSYKTVYLKLPSEVTYTLHRHNLSNDTSSSSVGKTLVGLMNQQLVWTQKCSCGFEDTLTWEIPIPEDNNKYKEEEVYVTTSTSLMID
jgi:hypothetical protein